MRYFLKDKQTEPEFKFYVKENTSDMGYYLFHDYEKAYNQAKALSLTGFPIAIIREPRFRHGEWFLDQTHTFIKGKCSLEDDSFMYQKDGLHAKFYTDAGKWLNPEIQEEEAN